MRAEPNEASYVRNGGTGNRGGHEWREAREAKLRDEPLRERKARLELLRCQTCQALVFPRRRAEHRADHGGMCLFMAIRELDEPSMHWKHMPRCECGQSKSLHALACIRCQRKTR